MSGKRSIEEVSDIPHTIHKKMKGDLEQGASMADIAEAQGTSQAGSQKSQAQSEMHGQADHHGASPGNENQQTLLAAITRLTTDVHGLKTSFNTRLDNFEKDITDKVVASIAERIHSTVESVVNESSHS